MQIICTDTSSNLEVHIGLKFVTSYFVILDKVLKKFVYNSIFQDVF